MRDILFRGKRVDNGEWIEGYFVMVNPVDMPARHRKLKAVIFPIDAKCNWWEKYFYNAVEVIPETVGQFTGVLDKNGEKIFEGDVVSGADRLIKGLEIYGYIGHENGSYVIVGDIMTHYRWLDYVLEVIGNVHNNPELLEGR